MRHTPAPAKPAPVPVAPKPGYVPKPAEHRNEIRDALKLQPYAVRAVTAALLPPTPKLMAGKLQAQIALVEQARQMPVRNPQEQAQKDQVVKAETAKLAALVESSKIVRNPELVGVAQVVAVDATTAKARTSALAQQLTDLTSKEKDLRVLATKAPPSTKPAFESQQALVAAKKAELEARRRLLAKGQDTNKPARVAPSQVSVQREPVKVPLDFKPPEQGEVVIATSILVAGLPPRQGETPEWRRKKLHALLERVLARKAERERKYGPSPTALQEAVTEVLQKDEPVIATELAETGGIAKDDAAETMSVFVDAASDEIARAAAGSAAPSGATGTPDQVLEAAKDELRADVEAPRESWDDIREDIVFAEQALPPTPLYEQPRVWIAGGVGLILLSLALRR